MSFHYEYARPALTVDCVVAGFDGEHLKLLLIERGLEPFRGRWALPGGFVRLDEELEDAARRELMEETSLRDVVLEQFHTFGAIARDPRERVVSVGYVALTRLELHSPKADTDAKQAVWFRVDELPPLAFDHADIVARGLAHLREAIRTRPAGFDLLPAKFTLSQLQALYEAVLNRPLDPRNFRKRVVAMDILRALPKQFLRGRQRPAQLYEFDRKRYAKAMKSGVEFQL